MLKPIEKQIAEYMDYCESVKQLTKSTLTAKKSTYKQFISESECNDLRELKNKEFNKWMKAQAARGVSPRTINMRRTHLVAMIRYHREMGLQIPVKIPLIPKLKEGPIRRVWYDSDEIAYVLSFASDPMDWLLIRIAFDTGLRITELTNLTLTSFDKRDPKHILVVGKGFKPGEVYISDEARERLDDWIATANVTDWLWLNEYNRHMGTDRIRQRMGKVFIAAGYDNFYPHALRHSCATNVQRQGATKEEAQVILRHSSVQTTERYLHGLENSTGLLFDKFCNQKLAA